jgi:hypothetical protein
MHKVLCWCFQEAINQFSESSAEVKKNRKFRVATEIGSTFFGCWSVTGQLKK